MIEALAQFAFEGLAESPNAQTKYITTFTKGITVIIHSETDTFSDSLVCRLFIICKNLVLI